MAALLGIQMAAQAPALSKASATPEAGKVSEAPEPAKIGEVVPNGAAEPRSNSGSGFIYCPVWS